MDKLLKSEELKSEELKLDEIHDDNNYNINSYPAIGFAILLSIIIIVMGINYFRNKKSNPHEKIFTLDKNQSVEFNNLISNDRNKMYYDSGIKTINKKKVIVDYNNKILINPEEKIYFSRYSYLSLGLFCLTKIKETPEKNHEINLEDGECFFFDKDNNKKDFKLDDRFENDENYKEFIEGHWKIVNQYIDNIINHVKDNNRKFFEDNYGISHDICNIKLKNYNQSYLYNSTITINFRDLTINFDDWLLYSKAIENSYQNSIIPIKENIKKTMIFDINILLKNIYKTYLLYDGENKIKRFYKNMDHNQGNNTITFSDQVIGIKSNE